MNDRELTPNINVTQSTKLDRRSIRLLKDILPDNLVDCDQLQEGGTLPNIDGYLDILCQDGTAKEKISVQVKHLTYPEKNGDVYYDIPMSIYAYAERHKGELVIFIACDDIYRKFYWRYIDVASIKEFKRKSDHIQQGARYHFSENEKCSEENVEETIELWRKFYKQKMESIKDEKMLADEFVSQQRMYFNSVSSELYGVKNSHIIRFQVNEIMQWINKDIDENKNICLLVGDAGVGKSAVLKDLISLDYSDDVKFLCIKADYIDDNGNLVTLDKIRDVLAYYSTEVGKVILIVDQIDALSQSLTNDRKHLNMMMTVLSSLHLWSNIKAVVSCRKYDLEYDSILNHLKDTSTIVEIGELTDEEVAIALNNIENGLSEKIDKTTIKILRTVQMLDTFSILYQRNKQNINFNSQIELYDALWDNIICESPSCNDVEAREKLMYKLAETVRIGETLKPHFLPLYSQKSAFEYLASNGVIRREGRNVSFFHQTFYEYTLARYYSENNRSFACDIKKDIQGLEIRSIVKAVLDFKRGHDIMKFVEEAKNIIYDSDIRLHLKLLTLSLMAFINEPLRIEKEFVFDICKKDEKMLAYFIRGVNSQSWFPIIRKLLEQMMPGLKRNDKFFFPVISCLSRYTFCNPEIVYDMINMIEDIDSREQAFSYVLVYGHNNYSKSCVLKVYTEVKPRNTYEAISLIREAFKSNIEFAFDETKKMLLEYLTSKDSENKHDGYELVEGLCAQLYADYPTEMLGVLHYSICETVRQTANSGWLGYTTTDIFNGFITDEYISKLLKMYEDILCRYASEGSLTYPLVEELLSLNNETTLSMAFAAMSASPRLYDNRIRILLNDNRRIEIYLLGDVEYFFLKMLRKWYDTLDENEAESYQRFLLSYMSKVDFLSEPKRKISLLLYPHLWRDKWKLICNTLPNDNLIPDMKKCSQELMRRFVKTIKIERPDHSITAAFYCGGVVSDDVYGKWPVSNWLNSFLKLNENKLFRNRKPINLHVHAEAFKKCVTSTPEKFYNFILDISIREDIQNIYKIAGLEGLLAGGISPYSLWNLSEKYITEEFARRNSYSFGQIAEYYIKEENQYIDRIIKLCKTLSISPFAESAATYVKRENIEISEKATDLLNKAINSYQGCAAELLVHICAIPSYRPMIYSFFTDYSCHLHECIKIIPFYYLNVKNYYDENLYFPMMNALLSGLGCEALYLRANLIQWCFYHRTNTVCNYIDRIETDNSSHDLLMQIYFYGMIGENSKECENRLNRILTLNDEDIIAKVIEISMKLFEHIEYRDLCIKYLERYAADERVKVIDAYCRYCKKLPIEAFNWYCGISKFCIGKNHHEIYSQLEYVKKCISTYPVQCYKFISDQKFLDIEGEWYAKDSVVEVLLEIYKKLKYDDREAMNGILNLFDEYIYYDNRIMKNAVSLIL